MLNKVSQPPSLKSEVCRPKSVSHLTCYKMMLLSEVEEQKLAAGNLDAIAFIKGKSPVTWQYINRFGSIEFSDDEQDSDIKALAVQYADAEFWHQAARGDDEVN